MRAPNTACLLLHGFGSSPFEMQGLVPGLRELGCSVDSAPFPGHDASIEEFRKSFYPDWYASAKERYEALVREHERVVCIGFSMGASITLSLAAELADDARLAGAFCFAPAYGVYRLLPLGRMSWIVLTPLLQYIRPVIPLAPASKKSREIAPYQGYEGTLYLPQLHSMARGIKNMRERLPRVRCPLYLMYDLKDSICPAEFGLKIARAVSSTDLTLRYTRIREKVTSHHMLTTHQETRDFAAAEVRAFVARLQGTPAGPGN
ncbi:alpha/beta fold hydrolase [Desulfovibrio sp. OttesenSCG-928-A18]|nr:alpha/beta fold hydrolase [Desulfovibrio sp. OttesenSCG-928-A18]